MGVPQFNRSDRLHLDAAEGWLGLRDYLEANEELERITARLRAHPDVLKVRWRVYAMAKRWDACLDIARALTDMEPDQPGGWIDHAQSLHRLDRMAEAYEVLSSVAERFPENTTVFYHLAPMELIENDHNVYILGAGFSVEAVLPARSKIRACVNAAEL